MAEQNDDRPGEREHFKNALIHVVQLNEAQADRLIMQNAPLTHHKETMSVILKNLNHGLANHKIGVIESESSLLIWLNAAIATMSLFFTS
jgi:hypothetical protein